MEGFNVDIGAVSVLGDGSYEDILFRAAGYCCPRGNMCSGGTRGRGTCQAFPSCAAVNGVLAINDRCRRAVVASDLRIGSDLRCARKIHLDADSFAEKFVEIGRHGPCLGTRDGKSGVRDQGVVNRSGDHSGGFLGDLWHQSCQLALEDRLRQLLRSRP